MALTAAPCGEQEQDAMNDLDYDAAGSTIRPIRS
jgi:hypothetical protein